MSFSKFEKSEQLRQLILEDASKLKMRQETDTIDIVDDLRYAVNESASSVYQTIFLDELVGQKETNKQQFLSSINRTRKKAQFNR